MNYQRRLTRLRDVFVICIRHLYSSSVFVICIRHLYSSSVFVICIRHLYSSSVFVICANCAVAAEVELNSPQDKVVVELRQQRSIAKIELPISLLPGAEYGIPVTFKSFVKTPIDLSAVRASCGCVVTKFSSDILVEGQATDSFLKIQTPLSGVRSLFEKSIIVPVNGSEPILVGLLAEIIPYVTCVPVTKQKRAAENSAAFETTLTFERDELDADCGEFAAVSVSKFTWIFDRLSRSTVKVTLTPVNAEEIARGGSWIEVCRFKRKSDGLVFDVPVPISLERVPSVLPSVISIDETGQFRLNIVGDFCLSKDSIFVYVGQEKLEVVCTVRSKRVHVVEARVKQHVTFDGMSPTHVRVLINWNGQSIERLVPIETKLVVK